MDPAVLLIVIITQAGNISTTSQKLDSFRECQSIAKGIAYEMERSVKQTDHVTFINITCADAKSGQEL